MINVLSFTDLVFEACMKQSINNELMFDFFFLCSGITYFYLLNHNFKVSSPCSPLPEVSLPSHQKRRDYHLIVTRRKRRSDK